MTSDAAASLIAHINRYSVRFSASYINYVGESWVIIRDAKACRNAPAIEPVRAARDYLERTDRRTPLDAELHAILKGWQVRQLSEQEPPA